MALTITNLSDAAKQAVIDRATNAGVSSPADIRNILLAKLVDNGAGGGAKLVTVADDAALLALTLDDINLGDLVVVTTSIETEISGQFLLFTNAALIGAYAAFTILPVQLNLANYVDYPWLSNFLASEGEPFFDAINALNITADGGDLKALDSLAAGPDLGIGNVIATYDVSAGRNINSAGDITSGGTISATTVNATDLNSTNVIYGVVLDVTTSVSGPTVTASATLNIPMWTVGTLPVPGQSGQLCVVTDCVTDHSSSTRGALFSDAGSSSEDCFLVAIDNAGVPAWKYA